jgi:hypothetical protein
MLHVWQNIICVCMCVHASVGHVLYYSMDMEGGVLEKQWCVYASVSHVQQLCVYASIGHFLSMP